MSIQKKQFNELLTTYNALAEFKKTARERIEKKCGWSRATFFKMFRWPTKMSEAEWNACKEVLDVVKATVSASQETIAKA